MAFHKAQRKQAKLRLALCGPSGSGKTYSALLIAQGLAPESRIALIDTERGSGELYADLVDYDIATLTPPYTPERYIQLIREAEQTGYDVLIIDSLSHAWTGQGGVLDMHERAATASKGNAWAAWREVTPQHNALVETMIGANLHLIATLRTKTAYEVTDENGKKKPVKVGLAPVQREGMEYEFSLLLDLTVDSHIATAAKDRTSLFDSQHFTPTPATGAKLREWLDSGIDPVEDSAKRLDILKVRVDEIDNVPHLENWWRAHQGEINALLPTDREVLKAHCATRKAAILEALNAKPEDSKKASKGRSKKGNGEDHIPDSPAIVEPQQPQSNQDKGQSRKINSQQIKRLEAVIKQLQLDQEKVLAWTAEKWGIEQLQNLTFDQYREVNSKLVTFAEQAWNEIKDKPIDQREVGLLTDYIIEHELDLHVIQNWAGVKALYEITNAQLKPTWAYLHKLSSQRKKAEYENLPEEEKRRRNMEMMRYQIEQDEKAGRNPTWGT